jgi:hypothetical protein
MKYWKQSASQERDFNQLPKIAGKLLCGCENQRSNGRKATRREKKQYEGENI